MPAPVWTNHPGAGARDFGHQLFAVVDGSGPLARRAGLCRGSAVGGGLACSFARGADHLREFAQPVAVRSFSRRIKCGEGTRDDERGGCNCDCQFFHGAIPFLVGLLSTAAAVVAAAVLNRLVLRSIVPISRDLPAERNICDDKSGHTFRRMAGVAGSRFFDGEGGLEGVHR